MVSTLVIVSLISLLNLQPVAETEALGNIIASKQISLENRQPVKWVNDIFKENILLNLAYLRGEVKSKNDIDWEKVKRPFIYSFKLQPGQTFAFHQDVKESYKQSLVKTTNAYFNATQGFKTDGYLYGDGVCHLASLIYWTAKDANLETEVPKNHDFANIADISKEYGVSIYYHPGNVRANAQRNLYITNNRNKNVEFRFEYDTEKVSVTLVEIGS